MKSFRPLASTRLIARPTLSARRALITPQFRSNTTAANPTIAAAAEADIFGPQTLSIPPPCRTPKSSAKLPALHARLCLHPSYPIETLARALVHPSADADFRFNCHSLDVLGASLLNYYVSEHLLVTYPRLPTDIHKAAVDAYIGQAALSALGHSWGIEVAYAPVAEVDAGLLQLKRLPPGERPGISNHKGVTVEFAMSCAVRAIFAGVYLHEGGLPAVRQFIRLHLLSRKLDIEQLFLIKKPTVELARLCSREGFAAPVARLHAETGRRSSHAVFVVGVYSGEECLGEGHGGSLDEARIRASTNALKAWYLYSPLDKNMPSQKLEDQKAKFKPAYVDVGEVII